MSYSAGVFGRQERSLESFVASPAGGSPLVAFLGNNGYVPLVSLASRLAVGELKMSGTARTAAFSPDGLELLTSGAIVSVHPPVGLRIACIRLPARQSIRPSVCAPGFRGRGW
jgi:hypothetical protein